MKTLLDLLGINPLRPNVTFGGDDSGGGGGGGSDDSSSSSNSANSSSSSSFQKKAFGGLGSLCCEHGINIATFHLGRREAGGEAIALVEIDGGLPKAMLLEIRALDQVVRADALHFSFDI